MSSIKILPINTRLGKTKFLLILREYIERNIKFKNIKYSFRHKDEEQIFDFKLTKFNNELIIKITEETEYGVCLKMTFSKPYINYDNNIAYKKSEIDNINRGNCGYKDSKKIINMSGSFSLAVADYLNIILNVSVSELRDDSRIKLCNKEKSLKILFLFKYGKTWYERAAGFKLKDKEIYDYIKNVGELRLSELYNTLLEIDNDIVKSSIDDIRYLKSDKISMVSQLLDRINLSKNAKIKTLLIQIFQRDSPYTECEQKFLWDFILELNNRKYIRKSSDPKYKLIKQYYKLQTEMFTFSKSVKKYN